MLLLPFTLAGADLSGTWLGQIPGRLGPKDVAFKFTHAGTVLGGKMYGDYGSTPISDGLVAGDLVTFVVTAQEQAGNQINETRVRFTGKLTGNELELVRDQESSKNAGNGGAAQVRPGPKQTFKLERLP